MDNIDFWLLSALLIWNIFETRATREALKGTTTPPHKPYKSLHDTQTPSPSSKPAPNAQ